MAGTVRRERTLRREVSSTASASREAGASVLVKTVRGVALGKLGAWNGIQGASVKCGGKEVVIENINAVRAVVYAPASGARLYPLFNFTRVAPVARLSTWLDELRGYHKR